MMMVRVENVAKSFLQGGEIVHALAGVTFDVAEGTFVSIMGASGCGKSTLLHVVGGIEVPNAGVVRVGPFAITGMADDELTLFRRRQIGFIFQAFNLLPTLSAEENVALPLLLDGKRPRDVRSRVRNMLELVGLSQRRTHRPSMLSGGEMQRVAIARALVTEPALLLADEPTGSLDSRTGDAILQLLRETAQALGQTVLMVTHAPHAAAFSDRVITMHDGRITSDRQSSRVAITIDTQRGCESSQAPEDRVDDLPC
jgi:putative ABC transport system ATP-binding protein